MLKHLMQAMFIVAALAACEQTKTQDYYMAHPDELAADLAECKKEGKNLYNCNEAAKAEVMLKKK
jgi:nitrous oxide reductase accessory protein NosL